MGKSISTAAIKEQAGVPLAQEPASAKPASAADAKTRGAFERVLVLLRTHSGHDFSSYKRSTLDRRIERRMGIHQIDKLPAYVHYLRENPQELDLLFNELLIGVTGFFRDPLVWQTLCEETLPALLASRPAGPLRAWVVGCSTGEEAYSLAIAFKEVLETHPLWKCFQVQIFASDIDPDAIDKARQGVFLDTIAADVSPERLRRFFTKDQRGYRVCAEIREMVVFSRHSLILDPPFTKLDFLSCRNLLIYLTPEIQKKLFPLFHYSLNPGGILMLGGAESIGHFHDLFATLSGRLRLFRRSTPALRPGPVAFPSSFAAALPAGSAPRPSKPLVSLQTQAEKILLRRYAPPSVLANDQGNILFINGRTGKYLEPAAGKANWNVFAMARDPIRYQLTAAFEQALRQEGPVLVHGLKIDTNDSPQWLDLSVEKLAASEPLAGLVMIVFTNLPAPVTATQATGRAATPAGHSPRLAEIERDLQQARAELQHTREAMQSSREELESTNEEMHSTNEELTTSQEEMQSLNEELQSVNAELQSKVEELSLSNNNMTTLLNRTGLVTPFPDSEPMVRRLTTPAANIIQLIPGAVGRPIPEPAPGLPDRDVP